MVKKPEQKEAERKYRKIEMTPRNMKEGEIIEGIFRGTRPSKYNEIFMLDKGDGTMYNIYGNVQFRSVLTASSIGKTFRITCLGKEKTSSDQPVWTFNFEIAEE